MLCVRSGGRFLRYDSVGHESRLLRVTSIAGFVNHIGWLIKSMTVGVDIQSSVCVVFCSYRERQRLAGAGDDATAREVRQDGQAGRSHSGIRFRLVTGAVPGPG